MKVCKHNLCKIDVEWENLKGKEKKLSSQKIETDPWIHVENFGYANIVKL